MGMGAGALSLLAFLPYISDTLRGQCYPLRSTWLIWTILSALSLFSNIQEGANDSLMFVAVQAGGTAIIFLLSIPLGMGTYLRAEDGFVLALAALGIALWWVTDSVIYALGISISVSALGGVVTIIKAYRSPHTESAAFWSLSACAAMAGTASVGAWDPLLLAYPLYLLMLYTGILTALTFGRVRDAKLAPSNRNRHWTPEGPAPELYIAIQTQPGQPFKKHRQSYIGN